MAIRVPEAWVRTVLAPAKSLSLWVCLRAPLPVSFPSASTSDGLRPRLPTSTEHFFALFFGARPNTLCAWQLQRRHSANSFASSFWPESHKAVPTGLLQSEARAPRGRERSMSSGGVHLLTCFGVVGDGGVEGGGGRGPRCVIEPSPSTYPKVGLTPPPKNGYKGGPEVGYFQFKVSGAGMKLNKQTILPKTPRGIVGNFPKFSQHFFTIFSL